MASFAASTAPHDNRMSAGDMLSMRMGITKIWKGDQVVIKTDGYAYSAYTVGAIGDQFVGVASETVDNRYSIDGDATSTAAVAGDRSIDLWLEGIFQFTIASSAIQTDVGLTAYTERGATGNPTTVTKTAGATASIVGVIVELVGSQSAGLIARVRITPFSTIAT